MSPAIRPRKSAKTTSVSSAKKPARPFNGLTLKPHLSEKAYSLSEAGNTYIFKIAAGANKFDVAQAVASQYDVSVENVRITSVPGKAVRVYRKGGRKSLQGKRSAIRKAYVTLKEGDKLPIFAAVEEPETPSTNSGQGRKK
ncbi:MAG TPA: 50S ribosomal protein L23 [Candidatus Saccharimonadales bacterium]|nr:50S ribosomal protein L23 [Candidatus Saccharimonadales bacterium]